MFNALLTFVTFRGRQARLRTFLGWTPGVRILVSSRLLSCGCLVGVYDTWSGWVVAVIDAPSESCRHEGHAADRVLWKRSRSSLDVAARDPYVQSRTA